VLETLGAEVFPIEQLPHLLPKLPDDWFDIEEYPPGPQRTATDPVVELFTAVWPYLDYDGQETFENAAQQQPLVPVGTPNADGSITRVRAEETELYRPREDSEIDIDLPGVRFITEFVYRPRGQLGSQALPKTIQKQQNVIKQIWRPNKFRFNELVRSTVDSTHSQKDREKPEVTIDLLALLKELGADTADPYNPLPLRDRYEVQPLYRLCRLPVPTTDGSWVPACRVYFGDEWLSNDDKTTVEAMFESANIDAPFLISPSELESRLVDAGHSTENDFDLDRWYEFFRWIGVSPHLRLKPFFDPFERRRLSETIDSGGVQRPSGGASVLGDLDDWDSYQVHLESALDEMSAGRQKFDSIYSVNSFEYWDELRQAAGEDRTVGQHLIDHLISWWKSVFSNHRGAILATHKVNSFAGRNSNSQLDGEYRRVGTNLWLWQLQSATWCPSTRGPVSPGVVWNLPKGREKPFTIGEYSLLPVLDRTLDPTAHEAQPLLDELGVRQHLSADTFNPDDARMICEGLAQVCDREDVTIGESLHDLQPIYREIQDHSPQLDGTLSDESPWADATTELQDCPVLCQVGDSFSFKEAQNAYFVRSPSIREDYPFSDLPFFILQEPRAARFGEYFGLHDFTAAISEEGEQIMENKDRTESVKAHLRKCAPYILCRLEAERSSQSLIDQDCSRMQSFLDWLTVFDEIEVTYTLDPINEKERREVTQSTDLYIETQYEGSVEQRYPQIAAKENNRKQWQLLSHALCTYLDVTQFEGIDALLAAETDDERLRYLQYANAPSSTAAIEHKQQELHENNGSSEINFGETEVLSDNPPTTESTSGEDVDTSDTGSSNSSSGRNEDTEQPYSSDLYDTTDLCISGRPISVEPSSTDGLSGDTDVDMPDDPGGNSSAEENVLSETSRGDEHHSQSQYDVEDLGAALVKAWEEMRLRKEYPECENPGNYIFHTDERKDVAQARDSDIGKQAFQTLEREAGIPEHFPGFDLLTVNPESKEPDRLIELKAATCRRRKPTISWNEWTTARNKWIQNRDKPLYYLYVVGHLSKKTSSDPYIRTIPNPFRLLDAQIDSNVSVTKSVQVDVNAFSDTDALPGVEGVHEIPVETD